MMKKIIEKYFLGGTYINLPLIVNLTFALITLPVVLKSLSVSEYGKWQFVLAFQSWLLVFTATNITSAAKKGIVDGLNGTFLYAFLKRYKLVVAISGITAALSLFSNFLGKTTFSFLLLILTGYLMFGYLFQTSFFEFLIAKKKFKQWSFWQIIISSFSILGSAAIAYITKNIIYFAAVQLWTPAVISLLLWFYLLKKENLMKSYKEGKIDKECISYGLKLIPVNIISITTNKISNFIIGPFFGFANLAVFSIADKLRSKSSAAIKSLRLLFYADFAEKKKDSLSKIINKNLLKLGLISLALMIGFMFTGVFYIKLFLPQSFHSAILYYLILALSIPSALLSIIMHIILESHLRYKEITMAGVLSNILNLIVIIIFGFFGHIIGICVALVISSWLNFLFYYLVTIKKEFAIKILKKYPFLDKLAQKY